MSTVQEYGKARHEEWLARQTQGKRQDGVVFEDVSPTYVIRMGFEGNAEHILTNIIGEAIGTKHGAHITFGYGLWQGTVEKDAEITIQATSSVLADVVKAIAQWYPNEEYLHVERHDVPTSYVKLSDLR